VDPCKLISSFSGSKTPVILALAVILLSTTFQISRLTTVNPGFFCDEASILFNARCIAEDGRDEHGVFSPLFFKAFGEYKSAAYIYATSVIELIFKPDPHAGARVVASLGLGLTLLGVFLLLKIFSGAWWGLFGVALVSLQPWFFHYSQVGFELTLTPLFLTFGFLFWSWGIKGRTALLVLSGILFAGAFYNYAAGRILTPLLVSGLLFFYRRNLFESRSMAIGGFLFAISYFAAITPFFIIAGGEDGFFSRAEYLDVFRTPWIERSLGYSWIYSWSEGWVKSLIIGHEFLLRLSVFLIHYFSYYSPHYLFFGGDTNLRFGTPDFGNFASFNLFGFLVGVGLLLFKRSALNNFLLLWFLLYGLPGAMTWEDVPHSGRGIAGHPCLDLILIFGWLNIFQSIFSVSFLSKFTKLFISATLAILIFGSGVPYYIYQANIHGSVSAKWMQYGARGMFRYIEKEHHKYNRVHVVFTDIYYKPEIFALVYSETSCSDWRMYQKLPWDIQVHASPPDPYDLKQGDLYIYAPSGRQQPDPRLKKLMSFFWPAGDTVAWEAFALPVYENAPDLLEWDGAGEVY
jgi:hypothetical protein